MNVKQKENEIQLGILKYLIMIGAYAGKTKTKGFSIKGRKGFGFDPYTFRGFPDITGFFRQRLFFIEVKTLKGKLSETQVKFELECLNAGITHIVARNIDDVEAVLSKF